VASDKAQRTVGSNARRGASRSPVERLRLTEHSPRFSYPFQSELGAKSRPPRSVFMWVKLVSGCGPGIVGAAGCCANHGREASGQDRAGQLEAHGLLKSDDNPSPRCSSAGKLPRLRSLRQCCLRRRSRAVLAGRQRTAAVLGRRDDRTFDPPRTASLVHRTPHVAAPETRALHWPRAATLEVKAAPGANHLLASAPACSGTSCRVGSSRAIHRLRRGFAECRTRRAPS
jgi:hypothetical protein